MTILNLYNKNLRGFVGFFGTPLGTINTNTICPYTNVGGTLISTSPSNYGSTFTTWNVNTGGWVNWNPSSSIIPPTAKVEYAFLVWSTAYWPSVTPPYEVLGNLPTIRLTKPDGTSIPITPNPTYHLSYTQTGNWYQFTNGADITSLMLDNQYGKYMVTGVPTGKYSGSNGLGGWGIYILYTDSSFPYNNVNLNLCATGYNTTITISNLIVPITGPVNVKLYMSSVQGDLNYADSLLLNGVKLSGPFNPPNDFMNDKYVDYTGQALQTIGSILNQNIGLSDYGYYADQTMISNSTILTNSTTNIVVTQQNSNDWSGVSFWGLVTALNSATLIPATKFVNKDIALAGDTIIYTFTFTNAGSVNTFNTFIIDTLPNYLTFINNSLYLNSIPYNGNITTGLTLPNINPLETITISFSAYVTPNTPTPYRANNSAFISYNFIPEANSVLYTTQTTNIVSTTILSISLVSNKVVDQLYCEPNAILTYTIVLTNPGSQSQYNIKFIDTLPSNLTIIPGSLKQDGVAFNYNQTSMTLPTPIVSNSTSTITFKTNVLDASINPATNIAKFIGTSSISNTIYVTTILSNMVSTTIVYSSLTSLKYVDKIYGTTNDTITYTIVISNNGNVPATNLIFYDTLQSSITYYPNSFALNNSIINGVNPNNGVNLGMINPQEVITISFLGKIN